MVFVLRLMETKLSSFFWSVWKLNCGLSFEVGVASLQWLMLVYIFTIFLFHLHKLSALLVKEMCVSVTLSSDVPAMFTIRLGSWKGHLECCTVADFVFSIVCFFGFHWLTEACLSTLIKTLLDGWHAVHGHCGFQVPGVQLQSLQQRAGVRAWTGAARLWYWCGGQPTWTGEGADLYLILNKAKDDLYLIIIITGNLQNAFGNLKRFAT